ncbi:hypothetical protein ANCCAN_24509 [Ancylostoma caninum]|uniref:Vacuolar protein-sorting-associated protein 36 n=1 Tax=Ancylostoma caninum TaxID=29170 RepID=A0A368FFD2_ANCCA|nr:hypothetical protein ANCCAN_24509 [Ancylostoma caninum]
MGALKERASSIISASFSAMVEKKSSTKSMKRLSNGKPGNGPAPGQAPAGNAFVPFKKVFQSRTSQGIQMRPVGIAGLEKRLAENHQRTHETISQAFEDMSRLMETARDMVSLSKSIAEKLRSRRGEITEDETIAFKSYLLSLGVSDPVTKSAYGSGAVYFEKLGEELCTVLLEPLKAISGRRTSCTLP